LVVALGGRCCFNAGRVALVEQQHPSHELRACVANNKASEQRAPNMIETQRIAFMHTQQRKRSNAHGAGASEPLVNF